MHASCGNAISMLGLTPARSKCNKQCKKMLDTDIVADDVVKRKAVPVKVGFGV